MCTNGGKLVSNGRFGATADCATEVVVSFVLTAGDAPQQQRFTSSQDVRDDEAIQSVLIKIIDRANAKTVSEIPGVSMLK